MRSYYDIEAYDDPESPRLRRRVRPTEADPVQRSGALRPRDGVQHDWTERLRYRDTDRSWPRKLLTILVAIAALVGLFFLIRAYWETFGEDSTSLRRESNARLVAGETAVLPAANGSLAQFNGAEVEAFGARVHSIAGDEAFWVGDGAQRVLVLIDQPYRESIVDVDPGARVSFIGTVRPARNILLSDPASAQLLRIQGHYIVIQGLTVGLRSTP